MKSTFARRMSILLVLAMVLAMLPVAALAADTATTVYFQNDWNWSDIRVHYWGAAESGWPGEPMVDTGKTNESGNKIYSFEVPAGCTGILFTGLDNGSLKQSNDITDFNSDVIYYMSWNEQDGEHVESYDAKYVFGSEDPEEPVVTEPVVTEPVEEVGTITIYVDAVAANIATPYAWAWGPYGNAFTTWPGEAMTKVEGPGTVYSITVREDTANIIFSNNGAGQTADLTVAGDNTIWNGTAFVDYATYTPVGGEVVSYDYYLTGSAELMALAGKTAWDVAAIGLTAENGVYTYTFTNVPVGPYSLKITDGTWANTWGGTGADGNYEFSASQVGDVIVTFDGTKVTVSGSAVGEVTYPPFVVVGNVLGLDESANWSYANGAVMTDNGDGTYSYTFKALAVSPDAETPYEFKIVKDGTAWIPGGDNWKFFVINEASDVTITIVAETEVISINLGDNVVYDYPGTEPVITPMPEIDKVVVVGGAAEEGADQGDFLYGQNWVVDSGLNGLFPVEEDSLVYSATYLNVAAGSYAFKFAINGTWDINFASGLEVVSGEEAVAYFAAQGNSILNITEDGATVEFILDLTDTVNVGDNAKMIVNITYPEKTESKAPESMVIGDNEFATGTGDSNFITSTFTATESGTLMFEITYLNMFDSYTGEWSECPPMFIGMQGRGFGLMVNGENFWPNGTIEVVAGETYEFAVASFQGNASEIVVTLSWYVPTCDHKYAYSFDATNNLHTFTCDYCGDVFTKEGTSATSLKFLSAAPLLGDCINVEFGIRVPEGFENPYVIFEFNGKESYEDAYYVNASGRNVYEFKGINPQTIGDNICSTIYAFVDGELVYLTYATYSVRTYCINQLGKATTPAALKTLIADLLIFGEKTQIMQNYKLDQMITDGVDLSAYASTFPGLGAEFNKQAMVGTANSNVGFKSVSLSLSGKMTIVVTLTADDISKYTFQAEVNGVVTPIAPEDLFYNEATGRYELSFDKMKASAFDDVITFSILENGVVTGKQLQYSVNTYIQKNQAAATGDMLALLQAIYNYGAAAKALNG